MYSETLKAACRLRQACHNRSEWLLEGSSPAIVLKGHRSHFGSRYKLGCCGHAGLFGCWFDSLHVRACTRNPYCACSCTFCWVGLFIVACSRCFDFVKIRSCLQCVCVCVAHVLRACACVSYCEIGCLFTPKHIDWIPFGDHPLKLERYRED